MSKGVKIGIIVVAVIIVAVGAWLLIVRWGLGNDTASNNTNTANTNTSNTTSGTINTNSGTSANTNTTTTPTETPVVDDSAAVLRLARIVVERYGSFSNQNNFENITSLEPFMTERFKKESADYITSNQADSQPSDYYGISTEVLSLEATKVEGNDATVMVTTQRIESKGNADPTKFNQTAEVRLEKVESNWKVDNITWK